ncbi:hypothetical protein C5748_26105 [Phyllobacterium phragmitis]|uniref:Transglycosylase SLT domain-containing protein n=1 Tax=Phyllobacterium phragmitis TaxID=2670329 RepID=A0A2S9IJ87_9HYPH|nr:transglycosylase SLT domain-containing protein [Phyllobacterium phragmitis]PRD40603.1 hypothetical protein C5748_26105 [Phyllobacterium phragmitis]
MDRLILVMLGVIAAAPCAWPAAEPATVSVHQRLARWHKHVLEAARRFGVPPSWIYAVMDAESKGRTMLNGRPIISNAGAVGLMQVMPDTYRDMRLQYALPPFAMWTAFPSSDYYEGSVPCRGVRQSPWSFRARLGRESHGKVPRFQ